MNELYKLKEMLCSELEEYGSKGELTGGTLDVVDKLAHALKNLDRIIESKEMDSEGSYYDGGMMSGRGGGRYSRARGRRNARRDAMGRYSNRGGYSMANEEYIEQLNAMMNEVPQEAQKHIQKAIQEIEQM